MVSDSNESSFINILVAEDNDVSRGFLVGTLRTAGYRVHEATDGDSAIELIRNQTMDMAFVDINMAPTGGFEFIKHLVVKGIKLPTVIVTADTSGDILMHANSLGVMRLLQKPVEPNLLLSVAKKILARSGHSLSHLTVKTHDIAMNHEQLMSKAIEIARLNATRGKGRAFGAVVADEKGQIIGEGTNGITSQVDPTAHAEVMAIRQASEKLGRASLSDCSLYCSSMPTMVGQALIASVQIPYVYYGLSHHDVGAGIRETDDQIQPAVYQQVSRNEALDMFQSVSKNKE